MREAQLDKVYNRNTKCHRAGPDISGLDTESEAERQISQGRSVSTPRQKQMWPRRRAAAQRRHLRLLVLALGDPQLLKVDL